MKRFLKASTFLCVIVAMFAALLLKAGVAGAGGAPPFKRLNAVAAVSARNIWAVGDSFSGGVEQPLIEHWNGGQWSIVASARPPVGFPGGNLLGIEEISAHNIWAVGTSFNSALGTS